MPRDIRRTRPGFIFIPQRNYKASWKIIITDGSVETDVTEYLISMKIDWMAGRLAICNITLTNPYGKWLGYWNGGEIVAVYGEYGETDSPTNLLFYGKLENPFFNMDSDGYKLTLECKQTPELVDIKIVEQFDNVLVTNAIQQILDGYYSEYVTYSSLPSTTTRFTGNFRHVPGITALARLAEKANMDIYIDTDNSVQLFTRESVDNTNEYISYETNLLSMPRYGKDNSKIFNRIVVYGKEDQNIILLKTEEDEDSQDDLWRKDFIITENSLTTMDEVQDKTDVELSNKTSTEEEGRSNALLMPELKPAQNIVIQVPYCGSSGYKNIRALSHIISQNGFFTTVQIKDRQSSLPELFKDIIDAEERLKPYNNLNNMTDSYTVYFDESPDVWALINAEISDEKLQLESGKTSGYCTFDTITANGNITQCELRIVTNFPEHELCTYQASNNGGATWEDITPGTLHTFSSTGSQVAFRILLAGDSTHNPVFDMVCLLYKVA